MTEGNIESIMVSHGRNVTGSALEIAINRIMFDYDNNWESSFNNETTPLWTIPIEDMNVDVFVDDENHTDVADRFLRVRSELQLENRSIQSIAFLQVGRFNPPELEGALTVYSSNANIVINGSPLKIEGRDTDYRTGDVIEDAAHKPAITAPIENSDGWTSRGDGWITINGEDETVFEGEPDQFSYNPDMDGSEVNALVDELMKPGVGTIYEGDRILGNLDNPQITIFDRNQTIAGGSSGAGILIIPPGVSINMNGGLDFYGLIISSGTFNFAGDVNIYGGMIMTDEALFEFDPEAPDSRISGNPTLYYSSEILELITNRLSGINSSTVVDRILY